MLTLFVERAARLTGRRLIPLQAREREEKIRRNIIERAEKEKARKEIAELTKQVYEEVGTESLLPDNEEQHTDLSHYLDSDAKSLHLKPKSSVGSMKS